MCHFQTFSSALTWPPLYFSHCLNPMHSLSSAFFRRAACLPIHAEIFPPWVPTRLAKSTHSLNASLDHTLGLCQEAFILGQVWLPALTSSRMSDLCSWTTLFFPFLLLKMMIGSLWTFLIILSCLSLLNFSSSVVCIVWVCLLLLSPDTCPSTLKSLIISSRSRLQISYIWSPSYPSLLVTTFDNFSVISFWYSISGLSKNINWKSP